MGQPRVSGLASFTGAASGQSVANATWWMQPIIMHYLVTSLGFSASSAGLMLSVEMGSMAVASALAARFYRGSRFRTVALLAGLLAIAASFVTLGLHSYPALLLSRAVAGAGAGVVLMAANTVAGRFADPDKIFARLAVVNLLFGAVLLAALPLLNATIAGGNPYAMIVAATVVLLAPLMFLPAGARAHAEGAVIAGPTQDEAHGGSLRNIVLMAFATFIIGAASGTIWAFYAVIGAGAGLSAEAVEGAISMAIVTALFGTGVAAWVGGSLGRILPAIVGLVIMSAAIMTLSNHPGPTLFRVATCANIAALYFLVPYLFGAAAAQDSSGRGAAYAGSAFFFAGAVSPFIGGVLVETVGIEVVGVAVVVAAIITGAIVILVERSAPARPAVLARAP